MKISIFYFPLFQQFIDGEVGSVYCMRVFNGTDMCRAKSVFTRRNSEKICVTSDKFPRLLTAALM